MSLSSRAGLALAGAAVLAGSLAGCAKFDAALGRQWVEVTFQPTTTVAQLEHIRTACSHIPNVTAYPFPKQHTVINLMNSVRYDTTRASDANVAQLQQCLEKFPAVQGFTPMDTGDEGG
ncbi:MAG: hypothetical protein ACRDNZ_13220 [Streptosporangiaceae bacterium]